MSDHVIQAMSTSFQVPISFPFIIIFLLIRLRINSLVETAPLNIQNIRELT